MLICLTILLMGLFSGAISNDKPPYFFQLTKPAVISAEARHYEGIEDALIVIEDVTAGIKDTLTLIKPQSIDYSRICFLIIIIIRRK